METSDLFNNKGVHCVIDGQFGSTGKGALSYWLAEKALENKVYFRGAIYSGGPNSGHTFYHGGTKHVVRQLPVFSVAMALIGAEPCPAYLSAGAVVDLDVLREEAERYPQVKIFIDPSAAVVTEMARKMERESNAGAVASTMKGTGGALMRKIGRWPGATWDYYEDHTDKPSNVVTRNHNIHAEDSAYFMEISQGFSLGINTHEFYPHVTSRECTVMQGLADARIPATRLARTYMTLRTCPIRVGNTDEGTSGDWYPDQAELTWEEVGVEPETTTVTGRVRRVANFSEMQVEDAIRANDPDFLFVNFLNYLDSEEKRSEFIEAIAGLGSYFNRKWGIIAGFGPRSSDISLL
jgi:adenylosuccinate synthase